MQKPAEFQNSRNSSAERNESSEFSQILVSALNPHKPTIHFHTNMNKRVKLLWQFYRIYFLNREHGKFTHPQSSTMMEMERRKRQRKKSVRNVFHVVFLHPSKNSSTLATSFLSVDFRFYSTLCSPLSIMTSSLHETRIDFLSFSKDDLVTRFVGECRFENKWLNE